jgi:hypothetical protein
MRDPISALLAWFLPARGKHRAETVSTVTARRLPAHRSPRPAEVIEADFLSLVRPYVVAHERAQERSRQRERRRAAVLASLGQDYVPAVTA